MKVVIVAFLGTASAAPTARQPATLLSPSSRIGQDISQDMTYSRVDASTTAECADDEKITSWEMCRKAAASLGLSYQHKYANQELAWVPPGCWYYPAQAKTGLTGTELGFNPGSGSNNGNQDSLCKAPTYARLDASTTAKCADDEKITSWEECKTAAASLGLSYSAEYANQDLAWVPPGCWYWPAQAKTHLTGTELGFNPGSGGSNNGNQDSLCKAPTYTRLDEATAIAECADDKKITSWEECKTAASSLDLSYQNEYYGGDEIEGPLENAPLGCWYLNGVSPRQGLGFNSYNLYRQPQGPHGHPTRHYTSLCLA
jgi:hypothetical protein